MAIDLAAATRFMAGHARLLDRRRFDLLLGRGDAEGVLAALDAYRNADGGYGWGLEPDLRSAGSQPITALHAFEVMHQCDATTRRAVELCDWLATVSFDDGGIPFVLPIDDTAACAPWFATASADEPSLHGTAAVANEAWRLAQHDPGVAAHPWVIGALRFCLAELARRNDLHAHETMFVLRLLDAAHDADDGAAEHLVRLAGTLPPSGLLAVEGGVEGESLHPLDYAPDPGAPIRDHVDPEVIEADLARVESGQQADGGWSVDFASFSSAAALEWRGEATVQALGVLVRNGRLP